MSQPNPEPVLEYLTRPDNLPEVLKIIRFAEAIRGKVEADFWTDFESKIKQTTLSKVGSGFVLERKTNFNKEKRCTIYDLPSGFYSGLEMFLQPNALSFQGLKYRIEIGHDYYGLGLKWYDDGKWYRDIAGFARVSQRETIKKLKDALIKNRQGDIDLESDEKCWFWFENWGRNPFQEPMELWAWLAQQRNDSFYTEKSKLFWDFVDQTHELVVQANAELSKP